jgi:tetratricopeptide (TPR) repeat protein
MGFRLYKSVRLGKGVRLNLSKTGVGVSAGVPGLRYSVHSSGRTTKTAGIPGTGVYYRKDSRAGSTSRTSRSTSSRTAAPAVQMFPKAGLLAPKEEKLFVQGVTAYMQGRHDEAVRLLEDVRTRDANEQHVGEEYFAAMSLIALARYEDAIDALEDVVASSVGLPDPLMVKYGVTGMTQVQVTPNVVAELPISPVGAALMLAELYQEIGSPKQAIELLESLGSVAPDPIFALSLAELYTGESAWDDVVRVSEGFTNTDDATCELLAMRANALYEVGLMEAAIAAAKEALRSSKRAPELLRAARYVRALAYEANGKKAMARKDLERIYAEDSRFIDVAERLGLARPAGPDLPPPP